MPNIWTLPFRRAVDTIAMLYSYASELSRERSVSHPSECRRRLAESDTVRKDKPVQDRVIAIFRRTRAATPEYKRTPYSGDDRREILEIRRLRGWTLQETADYFVVHKNTVWAWARNFDRKENVGTFFGNMPWNRIADGVRWLVHEIRSICPEPEFGTRSVAIALVREGIAISRSSVRNILKEKKPRRPPEPIPSTLPPDRKPNPILKPTSINKTWHFDLCTLELIFIRFYIATIMDGFSRKILSLSVYRDAPTSNQMLRLLKKAIIAFGKPKFLVTDHGTQFCGRFRKTVKRKLDIRPVRGRIRFGYFMNGKIERFFRSFRIWSRLLLFPRTMKGIQNRLDVYRDWYNTKRGLWLHGGRTPEEVWNGVLLSDPTPIRERDLVKPAIAIIRHRFRGDPRLPVFDITIQQEGTIAA